MTLLYYDPVFLEHKTGDHPECAARIVPVVRHLQFTALDSQCRRPSWDKISRQRLLQVHAPEYLSALEAYCLRGGGRIEMDTVVSEHSFRVARRAAGAVCDAVCRVVGGEDRQAFCLLRPPGHHASRDAAMGFCLLNNVALGARVATRELGLNRALIVDWDVHHGNGTQDVFWEDPQVGYLSIHRWPFYPGTGAADETGAGPGLGTTRNLPVGFGIARQEYLELFANQLQQFAAQIRPQLVLISAGFDSHRADPLGSLGLESEDFAPLTRAVLEVAKTHAAGRVISVLEGGYDPDALTDCVAEHLEEMIAWDAAE